MKITNNLTQQEVLQELDWRALTPECKIDSEEVVAIIQVFANHMKVNPSGYGSTFEEQLATMRDILETTTWNLKNLWQRISNKHTFTHESIVRAVKYLADQLQNGDTPSWNTIDSFLVRQEGSIYTIEDLQAAMTKAYEEGYDAAVKDASIIRENSRPANITLT